jgi:hypothetical protein
MDMWAKRSKMQWQRIVPANRLIHLDIRQVLLLIFMPHVGAAFCSTRYGKLHVPDHFYPL